MNDLSGLSDGARLLTRSFVHLLMAALATGPLAALLLHRYRIVIARWMCAPSPTPVSSPPPLPREGGSISCRWADLGAPAPFSPPAMALAMQGRRAAVKAAMIYGAAGLLHAATTTAILAYTGSYSFTAMTLVAFWIVLAWPTSVIIGKIAAASRTVRWLAPVAIAGTIGLLAGGAVRSFMIFVWLLYVLPPLVLMLAVAHPRFRTAGLFVFPGVFVILTCTRNTWLAGGSMPWATSLAAAFVSSGVVAGSIRWIARRYEKKAVSDLDLMLDIEWLLLTIWQAFCLFVHVGSFSFLSMLPFLVYKLAVIAGNKIRGPMPAGNHRLLLLRTFGARRRSERLLDELSVHWRWIGSIQLIGAPDVASANLNPRQFLAFVSGHARRLFIQSEEGLARRLAELDFERDPDGRFRINECYCFDPIWRDAVIQLAKDSAAVLMDLRDFSASRRGCVSELRLLIDHVAFSNIVFLTDASTKHLELERLLKCIWRERMDGSPNDSSHAEPKILRASPAGVRGMRLLLEHLCAAAAAAKPPPLPPLPGG